MNSQEEVLRQVTDHLTWDQRVDASTIEVEVRDSAVVLRGTVPSFYVRMAAEYDAWSVPGVAQVVNELEVAFRQPNQVPTDESIRDRIVDTLLWNPHVEIETVDVAVESGKVTLTGMTDAYWKKVRIEEQVVETIGVRSVRNQLRVVPHRKINDSEIAKAIHDALARDVAADIVELRINVTDGVVKLEGNVRNRNTYIAAENVARHTLGVVDIDNSLKVTNPPRP
ncbi:MAG: BON domain-containing protein [Chitinivibrionales bacterium]|nr:BON domain-containing protein [Chitinivibrionales bacterium]MBD3358818.1 BON domain-containing protein [Chitinivibrionales bacterium]